MKRNLVGKILGKIKIFVQDFVPIRTALRLVLFFCQQLDFLTKSLPRLFLRVPSSLHFLLFFFSLISLIADGPHHYTILPVVTKDLPISPRFTPYDFLSRCKYSDLTTRQPMVEFYLLTFPRFPLRKKEHKSDFGKNGHVQSLTYSVNN